MIIPKEICTCGEEVANSVYWCKDCERCYECCDCDYDDYDDDTPDGTGILWSTTGDG